MSEQPWTPARLLTTGFLFGMIGTGVLAAQALQAGLTLSDPRWWMVRLRCLAAELKEQA